MADGTIINAPTTPGQTIATKEISAVNHELVLLEFGDGGGGATEVSAADPLPITGEVAVSSLPAGLATSANQQTDALTDAQLRATPVPISGTVSVSGSATDNTTLYSGDLSVTGAITGIPTTGYQSIIFSFSNVWSGILLVEGSEDNSIWEQKIVLDVNEFAMQDVINENGIFQIKSSSKYIRINIQQVSGTITALIVGRTVPGVNASDALAFAMDRSFNMPLYVSETEQRKDVNNALIPSDAPLPIYGSGASASGRTSILALVDTTGYQSISVQLFGTWAGTVVFQASHDGSNCCGKCYYKQPLHICLYG
jgi:hypothetical protein